MIKAVVLWAILIQCVTSTRELTNMTAFAVSSFWTESSLSTSLLMTQTINKILHRFGNECTVILPSKRLNEFLLNENLMHEMISLNGCFLLSDKDQDKIGLIPDVFRQIYLVDFEEVLRMENTPENEEYDSTRQVDTKFIVVVRQYSNGREEFLAFLVEKLAHQNIMNFIILMPSKTDEVCIEIYTWFPYTKRDCATNYENFELIATIRPNSKLVFKKEPFLNKFPLTYKNCSIKVLVKHEPPFAIAKHFRRVIRFDGLEIKIFNMISERLQLKVKYIKHPKLFSWGHVYENGTVTGCFSKLLNKEVDINLGGFTVQVHRLKFFDISDSELIDSYIWIVPRAKLMPEWKVILDAVDPIIVCLSCFVCLTFSLLVWVMSSISAKKVLSVEKFGRDLLKIYGLTINQPMFNGPKDNKVRTMLASFLLSFFVIATLCGSILTGSMTKRRYEPQIARFLDLAKNNMKLFIRTNTESIFAGNGSYRKVDKNSLFVYHSLAGCLEELTHRRDIACLGRRIEIEYLYNHYLDGESLPELYRFRETIIHISQNFLMRKRYFLKNRINLVLSRLLSSGFVAKLLVDHQMRVKAYEDRVKSSSSEPLMLKITHLVIPFIVLFIGLSMATGAFILELLLHYFKKQRNQDMVRDSMSS